MPQNIEGVLLPPKLNPGDRVRLVSPASTPSREGVAKAKATLEAMGLKVETGKHAFDEHGFLAGRDEDRLADFNDAIRDPNVKAIITTRGGKGAYRIADQLDFEAMRANPKLVVGFSEITILHMALWKHCRLVGLHGAAWDTETFGIKTAESFRQAIMAIGSTELKAIGHESTAKLTTGGKATGILLGGNQDMIASAAGWALPSFKGAILLLEAVGQRLGHIDRQLTMLKNSGHLDGIVGVAVGQYTDCEPDSTTQGSWTAIDVLRDNLHNLNVPVLGGLPIGHGKNPMAVPLGTMATLNSNARTLTVEAGVK